MVENTVGSCSGMFVVVDHLMSLWAFIQIALIVVCMGVRVPCFNALHAFVTSHLVSSRVQDVKLRTDCGSWRNQCGQFSEKKNEGFPSAKIIVRQKRSNYLERSAISDICNVHFSMHNNHMKMSVTVVYFVVFLQNAHRQIQHGHEPRCLFTSIAFQ